VSFSASTPGDLEWELRVATGNGDPVSTNLDFGRGFRAENVRLDRLWVRWSASDSVHVDVGKMKNPLRRGGDSNLIWDGDLNPRGIATSISAGPWFAVAGAFQMADSDRDLLAPLAAFQGGVRLEPAGAGTFRAGLGYLAYGGIRGHPSLYDDRFDGNTVDADGNHRFDYDIVTLMADYEFVARGIPLQLFTESARNTAAGTANRAFLVGIRAGRTRAVKGKSAGRGGTRRPTAWWPFLPTPTLPAVKPIREGIPSTCSMRYRRMSFWAAHSYVQKPLSAVSLPDNTTA
jgi:hypothetical protein